MAEPGPETDQSPDARRAVRPRWSDPRLAAGLVVIALCALLGARLLARADDTVAVWAARHSLQQGQRVGRGDLVRRQVRFEDQADADRYVSADRLLPGTETLDRGVGAGELLPRAALGRTRTGPLTEIPLSVGVDAVPSTVRVGSTVDVWVTRRGAAAGPATLVFDDVRVLETPAAGTSLGPAATRQVIVGVPEDQSPALSRSLAALAAGDVLLTGRRCRPRTHRAA
ncbi:MAG: hypothetical protein QOF53_1654, partial [Nocardioidaceae bacterium]|nr:hypothetical protein [Nocardioidaceae bacterium]